MVVRLKEADFYVPAYRMIFGAMVRLYEDNQPIDTLTVADRLTRMGNLDKVGGVGRVAVLWDKVPSAANVGYYTEVVAEHAVRRRMLDATRRIGDLAMNLDMEIERVLDEAEQTVLGVAQNRAEDGLERMGGLLEKVLQKLEEAEKGHQDVTGLSTGLVDLDRKLGGLQPGTLVVVAGRPGMGKSALAMNIASHVALNRGPVALFSLEMSPMEIAYRWLGSHARVNSMKLRSGLDPSESARIWPRLVDASASLYPAPLHADEGSRTVTDIRAQVPAAEEAPGRTGTGGGRLHAADAGPCQGEQAAGDRRDQPQPQGTGAGVGRARDRGLTAQPGTGEQERPAPAARGPP